LQRKERLKDENGIKAHPTQKPLKLIQQILLTASNKGDLVLIRSWEAGQRLLLQGALGRKWIVLREIKNMLGLLKTG